MKAFKPKSVFPKCDYCIHWDDYYNSKHQGYCEIGKKITTFAHDCDEISSKTDLKEILSLVKPGDADMVDGVVCALTFNPSWAKHIEVMGRVVKIIYLLESMTAQEQQP